MGSPRLQGKVALITGASQGIGASTARLFAAEGATVLLADIQEEKAETLSRELSPSAHFLYLNVTDPINWDCLFTTLLRRYGHLDILVNNAGIMGVDSMMGPQDPEHATLESWKRVQEVNIESVFLGCKHAIRLMKERGGTIVNVSSRSGIVGVPSAAAYAASKAAVRNHTKSVALYCCEQGYPIRCNSVHPAAILTPLWEPMLGTAQQREASLETLTRTIPMHRMGTPEEVAYAILFLASEESGFITGSEVIIDGGILAGSSSSPGRQKS